MPTDNLAILARVKALALAACIEAGGRPCWVAANASAALDDSLTRARSPGCMASGVRGPLTPRELDILSHCSPRLIASLQRAILAIERGPAPGSPLALREAARVPLKSTSARMDRG